MSIRGNHSALLCCVMRGHALGENTFQAFFSGSFIRRKISLLKKCCVSKASFLLMREVLNSGNLYTGNFFRSQVIFFLFHIAFCNSHRLLCLQFGGSDSSCPRDSSVISAPQHQCLQVKIKPHIHSDLKLPIIYIFNHLSSVFIESCFIRQNQDVPLSWGGYQGFKMINGVWLTGVSSLWGSDSPVSIQHRIIFPITPTAHANVKHNGCPWGVHSVIINHLAG